MDAPGAPHVRPHLFRREAHDGREQPHQRVEQAVKRRLRAAPRFRFRRRGVQPVLQHVEVDRAEVHRREGVHRVVDLMEFEVLVPDAAARHQVLRAQQDPLVDLGQLVGRHRVLRGSKSETLPSM